MTDSGMNVRASASGSQSDNSMFHWIREGLNFAFDIPHTDKICVFGVEQCTVAGDFISNMADCVLDSPVAVVSDTRVPGWVGEGALSIILSTTGGSAEMIEVMDLLDSRGSELVCITPDGPIASRCTSSGGLVVPLPSDVTGFEAAGFCMGALVSLVSEATGHDFRGAMQEAVDGAESFTDGIQEDYLRNLSVKLKGRVNAFYSTSDIHACSKWWKHMFDINCTDLSFFGELPEFDHNELVGWSDPNAHAPELSMVVLKGSGESELVEDIVNCMTEVLSENGREVVTIPLGGGTPMESNLRGIALGYMMSRYVGRMC